MLLSRLFLRKTKTRKTTVPPDCMALELDGTTLKLRDQNGNLTPVDAGGGSIEGAVRYDQLQSLNETQKANARTNIGVTSANLETANKAYVKNGATGGTIGDPDDPFPTIRAALDGYAEGASIRHLVLLPQSHNEPFGFEGAYNDPVFFIESANKALRSGGNVFTSPSTTAVVLVSGSNIPSGSYYELVMSSDRSVGLNLSNIGAADVGTLVFSLSGIGALDWNDVFANSSSAYVEIMLMDSGRFSLLLDVQAATDAFGSLLFSAIRSGTNDSNVILYESSTGAIASGGMLLNLTDSLVAVIDGFGAEVGGINLTYSGTGYNMISLPVVATPTDLGGNYTHTMF